MCTITTGGCKCDNVVWAPESEHLKHTVDLNQDASNILRYMLFNISKCDMHYPACNICTARLYQDVCFFENW